MATTLTAYLHLPGNTREVFAFYAQALGATVETLMTYGDLPSPPPDQPPPEACGAASPPADAVMHACLLLPGGARLMANDVPPGTSCTGIVGNLLALQFDTAAEAEQAFAKLADGGTITLPMAPTFWAQCFGMLTDRYGVPWAVNGAPQAPDRRPGAATGEAT